MQDVLKQETEKLARSWMRHEPEMLNEYLIAGVEDPRINLSSIFFRHFLLRELSGEAFADLMEEECRFSAVINCLESMASRPGGEEDLRALRHALSTGADNAEGTQIPPFLSQTWQRLAAPTPVLGPPNYVAQFLDQTTFAEGSPAFPAAVLNLFCERWRKAIDGHSREGFSPGLSVLEAACGSANDYRFFVETGLARLIRYSGFDLCSRNISNARALFPNVEFREGNIFEIDAPDRSFDLCVAQDLFEHLSIAGMEQAVHEICRVAARGLCLGFFQMDERPEHVVRPVDDYHWNLLSMARMRELFAAEGFTSRVIHHTTFLRQRFGCEHTHNPNAYTFFSWRTAPPCSR